MFPVIPQILAFTLIFAGHQDFEIKLPDLPESNETLKDENAVPVDIIPDSQRGTVDLQFRGMTGKWQLSWNDQIDMASTEFPHVCSLELREVEGQFSGEFIGPVAGTKRKAIISGKLDGQQHSRLVTFQQREQGYVCSYQSIVKGGAIVGVWHDTKNRSGTFRLLKYQ